MSRMNGKLPLISLEECSYKPESFFSTFFKEHENDLAGCGPIQSYPSSAEIFNENDPAEVIYLIERGFMKLSQIEPDGKEIIVGLRGRYWLLGAPAVFLSIPYTYTAKTLTPSRLRSITKRCFLHLLKTEVAFSWEIYRQLSQSIYDSLRSVAALSSMSATERLRIFLCQLVVELCPEKVEMRDHYKVPVKHHEVAEIIGISAEHLSRLVKQLQMQKILVRTKGRLTIQDVSRLFSPIS
jgi:CRP-like cAMP-binding protein